MISFLTGTIIKVQIEEKADSVDLLTSAGIAYRVNLPYGRYTLVKDSSLELFTSFQVRESSQTLYGFKDEESRDFFEQLLGVSGVGPKTALSLLSEYDVTEIRNLVAEGDFKALAKAHGLGAKGAQKVIVELKGKFKVSDDESQSENSDKVKELKDALMALGFKGDELKSMAKFADDLLQQQPNLSLESLIQSVLRNH